MGAKMAGELVKTGRNEDVEAKKNGLERPWPAYLYANPALSPCCIACTLDHLRGRQRLRVSANALLTCRQAEQFHGCTSMAGVTVLQDRHLVARMSDFVISSVKAEDVLEHLPIEDIEDSHDEDADSHGGIGEEAGSDGSGGGGNREHSK